MDDFPYNEDAYHAGQDDADDDKKCIDGYIIIAIIFIGYSGVLLWIFK